MTYRLLRFAVCAALVAIVACAASARSAECAGWTPMGGMPPGLDANAYATTTWDPDGAGPAEALLVVAGDFSMAGNTLASRIAARDRREWHSL